MQTKKKGEDAPFSLEHSYLIAHRGASTVFPENTLPAFQACRVKHVSGIEFDVQFSADAIPVLFHDRHLGKCGRKQEAITSLGIHDIKKLDAGSWFSSDFRHLPVLTLQELFLALKGSNLYFFLEIKTARQKPYFETQHIRQMMAMADTLGIRSRLWILSFNLEVLQFIRSTWDDLPLIWNVPDGFTLPQDMNTLQRTVNGLGFLFKYLTRSKVQRLKQCGMYSLVYTCNQPQDVTKALKDGCQFILSDSPEEMKMYVTRPV